MKNKKISKNMFKALEDAGYFDIGISDELEDTEEIDIAGQWGTFVKDPITGRFFREGTFGVGSTTPTPKDGPWSPTADRSRLGNFINILGNMVPLGLNKKGGQIKSSLKKRKPSKVKTKKRRGVGKAKRGYGKAMK